MKKQIDSAAPPWFDLRSRIGRFESEERTQAGDRIRIELELTEGQSRVSADPRELDDLFSSLVLNVGIVMHPCGRLTVHIAPDDFENMPDEVEITDPSRWLHLAIEDHGSQTIGALFRCLLDPLINVAPGLAARTGPLRWSGRILFDEKDDESRVIHLLLPYAAEKERGH